MLGIILAWLLLLSLTAPLWASKKTMRSRDSNPKTVLVKSYTKKNGRAVRHTEVAHQKRSLAGAIAALLRGLARRWPQVVTQLETPTEE